MNAKELIIKAMQIVKKTGIAIYVIPLSSANYTIIDLAITKNSATKFKETYHLGLKAEPII
jgi:hypothetical protein